MALSLHPNDTQTEAIVAEVFSDNELLELCTPVVIKGTPAELTVSNRVEEEECRSVSDTETEDLKSENEEESNVDNPTENSTRKQPKVRQNILIKGFQNDRYDVLVTSSADLLPVINTETPVAIWVKNNFRMSFVPVEKDDDTTPLEARVKMVAEQLHTALRRDFCVPNVRMALVVSDSHAVDQSRLALQSLADKLFDQGIKTFGPYMADSFFADEQFLHFDGLIVIGDKMQSEHLWPCNQEDLTVVWLMQPMVCTMPGCMELSDVESDELRQQALRRAVYTAIDIYRLRRQWNEAHHNPLKKLYKEKRDESEKVRFSIPKKHEKQSAAPIKTNPA